MPSFARPTRLQEALEILERERPRVLAGGTALYAAPDARLADGAVLDDQDNLQRGCSGDRLFHRGGR